MDLITANEALERFDMGKRTFDRLVGSGALRPREHRKGTRGRPTALYAVEDVETCCKLSPKQLTARAKRLSRIRKASPVTPPPPPKNIKHPPAVTQEHPAAPPPVAAPDPVAEAKSATLDNLEPDALLDMLNRLRQAEKASAGYWSRCLRDNLAKPGTWSVAEIALVQRSWKEAADQVRRFEKELPRILYEKGRYVDATQVGRIFTAAVTGMCAELDMVGLSVAPLCPGKSALQIRVLIDDGVRRARRQVEKAWKELTDAKAL